MMDTNDFEREFEESYRQFQRSTQDSELFSFTTVLTDEEYEEEQREHSIEVHRVVTELLDQAITMPDEKIPEFVWNPFTNDFDDGFDYIRAAMTGESAIIMEANRLKNKYQNYFDWLDALAVWEEYHAFIEENYGSWEYYKEAVEDGLVSAIIHNRPKLKKSKDNKGLDKVTVPLSRADPNEAVDADMLKLICEELPVVHEDIENDESLETWRISRIVNRSETRKSEVEARIRGAYKRGVDDRSMDGMLQFVMSANSDERGILSKGSLADEIEAMHADDGIDPAIVQHDLESLGGNRTLTVYSSNGSYDDNYGAFMTRDRDMEEFFTALAEAGYDAMGFVNGLSMDKEAKMRLTGTVSQNTGIYSEKELKKMKKREKKARKRLSDRLTADANIRNILTMNKLDLSKSLGDDELSFTISDMLRGDY